MDTILTLAATGSRCDYRTVTIEVKGKPIEKTIEGLRLVIWGVGDMRNKHGDAHGATSSSAVPTPSEAGLCVNLAGAAALYLLEVFESDQHE